MTQTLTLPKEPWQKIADHITEKGIKQAFLCEKTGLSKTQIHFILTGKRILTQENLDLINAALATNF